MEKYLNIMCKSALFAGVCAKDVEKILQCFSASKKKYKKGEYILNAGDKVSSLGMVLCGSVHIIKEDFWGNRNILSKVEPGQIFAETYACSKGAVMSVSVVAETDTEIMFMKIEKILNTCAFVCDFHSIIIRNMVAALAEKNLMMNEKLTHITQRTTMEKIMSYLSAESAKCGSNSFEIPFNRQQLADYLSVDRSAMSSALGQLRDKGMISFEKNYFTIKK